MIPKIQKAGFGNFMVDRKTIGNDKDIIVFWDKFYTKPKSHSIDKNYLEKILLREPEAVVLGIGFNKKVEITPDAEKLLKDNNIAYEKLETPQAIKKFKGLVHQGKKVVAILHTTC